MNYKNNFIYSTVLIISIINFNLILSMEKDLNKIERFEYFTKLPNDMQNEITKYLNFKDLENIRLANKELKSIIIYKNFKKQIELANKNGLELIQFIKDNEFEKAIEIINSRNTNLNFKDKYGITPLIMAAYRHDRIGSWPKNRYDVNKLNTDQSIIKLLIKEKANLDIQDKKGNTALIYACENAYDETVESLINAKANLDLQNNEKETAVRLASLNAMQEDGYYNFIPTSSYDAILTKLITSGSNLEIKNNEDKSALDTNKDDIKRILNNLNKNESSSLNPNKKFKKE